MTHHLRKPTAFFSLLLLLTSASAGLTSIYSNVRAAPSAFTVIDASWGTISPVQAGPGQNSVPLTVSLLSSTNATSLRGTLNLTQGFTDTNGKRNATASQFLIKPAEIVSLTYSLNIASTVKVGTYVFPLGLEWNTTTLVNQIETTAVTVKLLGEVDLNATATPLALTAGSINNITLTLRNTGTGNASQISISATAPSSTSILNQLPEVSSLNASSRTNLPLSLYVPSFLSGSAVNLFLEASFTDAYGTARLFQQPLGFYVANIIQYSSPISISVQPSILTAGQVNNLTVNISNNGTAPVSGLSAAFSFPLTSQITWLNPDVARQALLAPGQTLKVYASAYELPNIPTSAALQVALTYYDSLGNFHQEARSVGILSRGIITLQPTDIAVTPQQPVDGEVFSITVTITDIGTGTAYSVAANVTTLPSAFALFGSGSNYLGDLVTSSPAPFTISFTVDNKTAPGTYQIPIQFTYRDNLRTNLTSTLLVPVTVVTGTVTTGGNASPVRGFGLEILLGTTLVVAVVMFGAGLLVGRRRSVKA